MPAGLFAALPVLGNNLTFRQQWRTGVPPVWALTLQAQACIFTGGTPVLPVLHWPPYRLFISKIWHDMPDDLLRRIRPFLEERKMTLQALVIDALARAIETHPAPFTFGRPRLETLAGERGYPARRSTGRSTRRGDLLSEGDCGRFELDGGPRFQPMPGDQNAEPACGLIPPVWLPRNGLTRAAAFYSGRA